MGTRATLATRLETMCVTPLQKKIYISHVLRDMEELCGMLKQRTEIKRHAGALWNAEIKSRGLIELIEETQNNPILRQWHGYCSLLLAKFIMTIQCKRQTKNF